MESSDDVREEDDAQPEELRASQKSRRANRKQIRNVLDTAKTKETKDECDLCGTEVKEFVICPNGKEICRECFNAGQC